MKVFKIIRLKTGVVTLKLFSRLINAIDKIEERTPFSHNYRFGYLNFRPSNMGTTNRASVYIQMPKLAAYRRISEVAVAKYNLQARGAGGEHTESEGGIHISNKRNMVFTEYQTF
ncbi:hypothetical protein QYM36_016939 [Artemia franciscana]|uniref:arginine kinase n=1 Tax=Artemia franciscana TaxID=6661 RepID=A0AA88H4J1_ARTSF|nr:hypothetical protein QYM36_016939 [Artemia franciscana]